MFVLWISCHGLFRIGKEKSQKTDDDIAVVAITGKYASAFYKL